MSDTTSPKYDAVIVGGGIHGVMLSLELVRHGLRPVLLERGRLGEATTANSSSIVHGGLRYLQQLDIPRTRRSFREQQWFLQAFPSQVTPLACLMPLYGDGLRRPGIFRAALAAYALCTRADMHSIRDYHLPRGTVVPRDAVLRTYPEVDPDHLLGGAIWHDARVHQMADLIADVAQWARAHGADTVEHMQALALRTENTQVTGVEAVNVSTGEERAFTAPVVFNVAGPWCRELTKQFGDERPELFTPVIGWNVLLDRPPLCGHALALQARNGNREALFFQAWDDRLHVGTRYAAWQGSLDEPQPPAALLETFLDEINTIVPQLQVTSRDVVHTYAGILPASASDRAQPAKRPVLVDHGAAGGPRGLYSFSGVKFTTARHEAERIVRRAFPRATSRPYSAFDNPTPRTAAHRNAHRAGNLPIA